MDLETGKQRARELEKMAASIPESDMRSYTIIPLTWADPSQDKVLYLRLPQEEGDCMLGGALWNTLRGEGISGLFDYAGGQLPRINPLIDVTCAWSQYGIAGQNPYDYFRSRHVLRDDIYEAQDSRALEVLGRWTWNSLGGGIITRLRENSLYDPEPSEIERFLRLPVISNSLGRWLKVSNRGLYDKAEEATRTLHRDRARLDAQDTISKLLDKARSPNKKPYAWR